MLSKVSQLQKGKYCMTHIYDISKVVKFLEWWLPRARPRGKGKLFNRYRVLVLQDKVLEICYTTMGITVNTTVLYT